ncbi:creatininase family protein [Maribacter sp. 2210JD10-5]|uniref:creatininase family protein n=1 Tax=Maribacter sp. 2210JD10-5 TaxID=3386272 RepID=UPI0039BC716E
MHKSNGIKNTPRVRWENLLPEEFLERQQTLPLVYLPLGMCEPHGHIAPFGLDTLKAVYLCEEAAKRFGGIVAPTLGYQIHEVGYHAQWLQRVVGEVEPAMTSMPPDVMLRFFLYQLRSFYNAGFTSIVVITGHAGGNEKDYRLVAEAFMKEISINIIVKADPELVDGKFNGDHAGKYEISQLLYLHPELMAMDRMARSKTDALGQFAQGDNAHEANAELGKNIIEESLLSLGSIIANLPQQQTSKKLNYQETEKIWQKVLSRKSEWVTAKPRKEQEAVAETSQWKPYEYY